MEHNKRLLSLDLLRGLDMILLTVVGPLFWAVNKAWEMPEAVQLQFKHAWGGFTLWDIIMPLFIFACGAAVPYALSKRLNDDGKATGAFWRHVLGRFALLWFCGMLVQGRLATLDPLLISPYNNTLQTIAAGYLIAALVMLIPVRALRVLMPVIFVAAYGVLLMSYDLQKYYDTITHTFSSFVISLCVIMTLFTLQRYNERIKFTVGFTTVFIFLIMMAFGTYWEVLEYVVDQITGTGMQYSPFDTVRDMFSNALGSMLGSLFIYIYMRRWSIEEFIDSINVNKKLRKFLAGKHGEHSS